MYKLAEEDEDEDEDERFDMMVIFSPYIDDVGELVRELINANYDFPVYIDTDGSFVSLNPCIPAEAVMYHNFLINKKGNPVIVGLPTADDNFKEVFYNVLDCN